MHDAVEPVVVADHRVVEQELQDRRGVGEAGRLQQHAIERRRLALGATAGDVAQGPVEVALDGAADAARLQQHHVAADRLHEQVIEADLAELVHQHQAARHAPVAQHAVEQGGLAAAEEAGDQRHRHALGRLVRIEQAHRVAVLSNAYVTR